MAINLYSKASVDSLLSAKLSDAPIDGSTYARKDGAWVVAGGGGSVSWGGILGTLADQTDLNTALGLKAPLASPTFTGTVTIPAGASISGYLTTSTASSTYLAKASNLSDLANTGTARTNLGLGGLAVLNDAPSNGSQYARQNGAWAVVTGGGGGGSGGVDIQTFSTAGTTTWTKPAGAKYVIGYMWGSGGGGGSGSMNATSGQRGGGGGGSGGGLLKFSIDASLLSATESVVIGAGGLGGASRTTATSAGINGLTGGTTSFAGRYAAYSGNNGIGGSLSGPASGGTGSVAIVDGVASVLTAINGGGQGTSTTGFNANFSYTAYYSSSGGGGGAGQNAGVTTSNQGGAGGTKPFASSAGQVGMVTSIAGGQAGLTVGTPPTNGTNGSIAYGGGTGGGGGAYRTGLAGMAGANGLWGGGGGGGSAADNGTAGSGAGGNGGAGALILITILG